MMWGYSPFTQRCCTEVTIQPIATEIRKAVKAIISNTIGPNVREPHLLNLAANLVAELILHICKYQNKHNS